MNIRHILGITPQSDILIRKTYEHIIFLCSPGQFPLHPFHFQNMKIPETYRMQSAHEVHKEILGIMELQEFLTPVIHLPERIDRHSGHGY